tara:strand:- start:1210 stop:2124 length:915 start_codon:yes stop_codon:yes gene_type:complete
MKKSYYVEKTFNNSRIDRWIRQNIEKIPQGLIEKNLRRGKIKLNNKKVKSSNKVKTNDLITTFNLNLNQIIHVKKKFIPSSDIIKSNEKLIIDNNDDFIVINKEAGISVQGGTKSKKNLIDIFSKSTFFENTKPYSVHRLDKETSGVFIIAKNRNTAQLLTSLFRLRKVYKTYLAICLGQIEIKSGVWSNELIRYEKDNKIIEKAKTTYKVLDANSLCSLVEMKPITGRKHQLRKQLSQIGHPIYGDNKYNYENSKKNLGKNLMLHSYQIKFMINNKKFTYTALLPEYFKKLLKTKRLKFPYLE